ncbi:J domain-containing protein [Sandaracinobacteroides hominis]|uniref:J domain-containing protein n=1 Tax=Sandaracinobacteroides hominis TaxID=2780086 RepID=UPI0018F3CF47|nr:DnaJ family molecular chaperone [Sandaracinobacteroides hominis]
MAIWALLMGSAAGLALGGPLGALAGAALGAAVDRVMAVRAASPQRKQVAFTIAAIALAAKMAQADGHASDTEAAAFERLFHVPAAEQDNMRRFYRLARQSVDGYEAYAKQALALLGAGSPVLEDLLEALLMIATVDGVHPAELDYLEKVAALMGFGAREWGAIRARHVPLSPDDPFAVLGLQPDASDADIRAAYRRLARDHHPDRHMAEGTPPEFIRVAEARMATINSAYAKLMKTRA